MKISSSIHSQLASKAMNSDKLQHEGAQQQNIF